MTKQDFGVLCDKYQVNKRAVKKLLKKDGLKRKDATKGQVLNCLMIYAPDLFWTRDIGDDTVEYLDKNIIVELIREMNEECGNEEYVEHIPVK
ncbi:MAG: hypothetical protein LHW59_05315, partial [Candidatus Cloacimonetes bacterium]|nr:hypothetical protein [Candidatus Cloacimonadota bacterium]